MSYVERQTYRAAMRRTRDGVEAARRAGQGAAGDGAIEGSTTSFVSLAAVIPRAQSALGQPRIRGLLLLRRKLSKTLRPALSRHRNLHKCGTGSGDNAKSLGGAEEGCRR